MSADRRGEQAVWLHCEGGSTSVALVQVLGALGLGQLAGPDRAAALSNDGKIPVLLYHSWTAADHPALERDLATIDQQGFWVIPAFWAVQWMLGQRDGATLPAKAVVLTCDDGARADWYDEGAQKSFRRIVEEFKASRPGQSSAHISSFVIGSPTARAWIDPNGGLTDDWWSAANESGVMEVYNHGADHDHPDINDGNGDGKPDGIPAFNPYFWDQNLGIYVAIGAGPGGGSGTANFARIDDYREADAEIRRSAAYIASRIAPAWPDLFAYPYGQFSSYLAQTYFPQRQSEHRTVAAFRTGTGSFAGNYLKRTTNRWKIPRFTHGAAAPNGWSDSAGLIAILNR